MPQSPDDPAPTPRWQQWLVRLLLAVNVIMVIAIVWLRLLH